MKLIITSVVAFAVAFGLMAPVVKAASDKKSDTPAVEEKKPDDVSAAKNDKPKKSKKDKDKDGNGDNNNGGGNGP